jgi:ABC-2 type transport system permease protein
MAVAVAGSVRPGAGKLGPLLLIGILCWIFQPAWRGISRSVWWIWIAAPSPVSWRSLDGSAGLKIAQQFDAIDEGPGHCEGDIYALVVIPHHLERDARRGPNPG